MNLFKEKFFKVFILSPKIVHLPRFDRNNNFSKKGPSSTFKCLMNPTKKKKKKKKKKKTEYEKKNFQATFEMLTYLFL